MEKQHQRQITSYSPVFENFKALANPWSHTFPKHLGSMGPHPIAQTRHTSSSPFFTKLRDGFSLCKITNDTPLVVLPILNPWGAWGSSAQKGSHSPSDRQKAGVKNLLCLLIKRDCLPHKVGIIWKNTSQIILPFFTSVAPRPSRSSRKQDAGGRRSQW